jgi:hypothetical protein
MFIPPHAKNFSPDEAKLFAACSDRHVMKIV